MTLAYRWQRTGPAQQIDEQPLFDRLAQAALVFDGRLDNRADLTNDLELRDDDSVSDAAIVLAAHRRWGRDLLPRLLGDFAFALWDGRERRLMLARDPRGVRAVSYAVVRGAIAFASEPRQLLRVSGVDSGPNLGFLGERLSSSVSHPSDTIFSGFTACPPRTWRQRRRAHRRIAGSCHAHAALGHRSAATAPLCGRLAVCRAPARAVRKGRRRAAARPRPGGRPAERRRRFVGGGGRWRRG